MGVSDSNREEATTSPRGASLVAMASTEAAANNVTPIAGVDHEHTGQGVRDRLGDRARGSRTSSPSVAMRA